MLITMQTLFFNNFRKQAQKKLYMRILFRILDFVLVVPNKSLQRERYARTELCKNTIICDFFLLLSLAHSSCSKAR